MALFYVDAYVDFLDAAERTATIRYRLAEQFDDTANAGAGNMDDVIAQAEDLITALNVLTWDAITGYRLSLNLTAGGPANISSNNQVRAFVRVTDDDGEATSIEVPAWDDFTFDEDSENLLSAAFETAALAAVILLRNPETNATMGIVEWAQSRTQKSRNVIS